MPNSLYALILAGGSGERFWPLSRRARPKQLLRLVAEQTLLEQAVARFLQVPDAIVLGRYLVLAGSIRFAIEFIRVNVRVLGPLTLAHLVSLVLVIIGTVMLALRRREA